MFRTSVRALALSGMLALAACGPQTGYENSPAPTSSTLPSSASSAPGAGSSVDVKLGYVVIDDNGAMGRKIGCNDSLVLVTCTVPSRGTPLESAIAALLDGTTDLMAAGRCQTAGAVSSISTLPTVAGTSGGYANPIGTKGLTLVGVELDDTAGSDEAMIRLSGQPTIAGVCETPRIQAQLEETAKANGDIDEVEVELNGDDDAWEDLGDMRG